MEALDLTVTSTSRKPTEDKVQKVIVSSPQMNAMESSPSKYSFSTPSVCSISEPHAQSQKNLATTLSSKCLISMIDNSLPCLSPGAFSYSENSNPGILFRCNICDRISSSLTSVSEHFLQEHKDYVNDDLFPSPACSTESVDDYPNSEPLNHPSLTELDRYEFGVFPDLPNPFNCYHPKRKVKLLSPMKCQFCDKNFYCRFYLQRHIRSHTGEKICHCSTCGKGFSELRNLRNHISRKHWNSNISSPTTSANQQQDCKVVKSEVCNTMSADSSTESVKSSDLLPLNMPVVHDRRTLNAKLRGATLTYKNGKEDVREVVCNDDNGKTYYKCSPCSISAESPDAVNHRIKHADSNPFQCGYCSYEAKTGPQLKVHLMRHRGNKSFNCRICNYSCVTRSDLNRHCKSRTHGIRMALQKQDTPDAPPKGSTAYEIEKL